MNHKLHKAFILYLVIIIAPFVMLFLVPRITNKIEALDKTSQDVSLLYFKSTD